MKQQNRLYRDAQNDYWEARSRRARRSLAARKAARIALSILVAVLVLGAVAVMLGGKGGSVIHRVEDIAGRGDAPGIEPEQEVEDSVNQAAGASVYTATAKGIVAMYQPSDGGDNMTICVDPRESMTIPRASSRWLSSAGGAAFSSMT